MKILHAIHGFLPQFRGGTELYLYKLAREQRAQGHDVEIVTGTTDFQDKPKLESYLHDGFRVWKIVLSGSYLEHWTRSSSCDAASLFADVVRKSRPDIVHVQHWHRLSRNLIETCYRLGVPAVCTLHDLWASCPRIFRIRDDAFCERPLGAESCTECVPRLPWMEDEPTARQIELFKADFLNEIRLAHRIICPSRAHGALVRRMMDVPQDRFLVLPHGTITETTEADARAPRPRLKGDRAKKAGPIRIGMWGHLLHMKGAHILLEALRDVPNSERFEVHIWGKVYDPKYKERLEQISAKLNVTWYGAFEPHHVRRQPLDLAIIPSICSESFSFVLDEAFHMGLPAIVSDRGALGERIGKAGMTFKAEIPGDLARILKSILKEPDLIDQWRRHIPELLEMSRHSQKLCEVYRDVLTQKIELEPDYSLPQRRERELAQLLREAEQLMFGYLGHIKREAGRGDHYESVVQKMILDQHAFGKEINDLKDKTKDLESELVSKRKLVEILGREVADFREAMVLVHQESPRFHRSPPVVVDVPEHVPGLGAVTQFVPINHEMMSKFADAVTTTRATIAELRENLRKRDQKLEESLAKVRERERKIDELKVTLADCTRRIDECVASTVERDGKIAEINRQLKDRDQRLTAAAESVEAAERRLSEQVARSAQREKILEETAAKLKEREAMVEELSRARADVERRLVTTSELLQEGTSGSRETIEKLSAELASAKEEAKTLSEELEKQTTIATEAKSKDKFRERLVLALAGLLDTLRKAMLKVGDADPTFYDTTSGLAKDLRDVDLPNLGKLGEANRRISVAIKNYMETIKKLKKTAAQATESEQRLGEATSALAVKDILIRRLAEGIEMMRRALTLVFQAEPTFDLAATELEKVGEHVPGLGDLETIRQTNIQLIQTYLNELQSLRRSLQNG